MTKTDAPLGRVRNWDEFQHYGGRRNLVWLKLYPRIFFDPEFIELSDAQRYHVIACFMIALQTGNEFPLDEQYLGSVFNATTRVNVKALLASKFIEEVNPASNAASKKRGEKKKKRGEKKREENVDWTMTEWNEVAKALSLPLITAMTNPRTTAARARVKQFGVDEVRRAIHAPDESQFLQGKKSDRPWKATYDWMMKPSNMTKVLEDSYRDHGLPKRRTKTEIEDDERRTQLMRHITEYRAAMLEAVMDETPAIKTLAKDHAKNVNGLVRSKLKATVMEGRFYELHDQFIEDVYSTLDDEKTKGVDEEVAKWSERGVKDSTHRRKLVQELLGLPDPTDFEIEDDENH